MSASDLHGLSQSCLVCPNSFGDGGNLPKVVSVVNLGVRWVEFAGELLEPARGPLDLIICVSHRYHPFIRGTGRTSAVVASR